MRRPSRQYGFSKKATRVGKRSLPTLKNIVKFHAVTKGGGRSHFLYLHRVRLGRQVYLFVVIASSRANCEM